MEDFMFMNAHTISEALFFLNEDAEKTKVIAGGTDSVMHLHRGTIKPERILAISGIDELKRIYIKEDGLHIGACATLNQIANNQKVAIYARALQQAAASVGSQQIRNLGTLGGNIVNGVAAADTMAPLLCLQAIIRLESFDRRRELCLEDVLCEKGCVDKKPNELLTEIIIPPLWINNEIHVSSYQKLGTRKALAIVVIGAGIYMHIGVDNLCKGCRIYGGALARFPLRFHQVEKFFVGKPFKKDVYMQAIPLLSAIVEENLIHRPWEQEYKKESIKGIYMEAFLDIERQLEKLGETT